MKQNLRQQAILSLVQQQGYVSTEALVEHFQVTPQTIRRDLNELADQNYLQRHHGGAALLASSAVNTGYTERQHAYREEKARIGECAAQLIPDGATLFMDIGTTPEIVAKALLHHKNLRIVTNNINVAVIFRQNPEFKVILAGGEIRSDGGIVGEATLDFISQFRLDYGILGISGIDSDGSLLEFDYHEVRTKQAIIQNSRHTILVTDHSKFQRNAMVNLGNLRLIEHLVTDKQPPESITKLIEMNEIQLHIC